MKEDGQNNRDFQRNTLKPKLKLKNSEVDSKSRWPLASNENSV